MIHLLIQESSEIITTPETSAMTLSFWELAVKGGFIMIPIFILSIFAVYIFFERFLAIRQASNEDPMFMDRIKDYIHAGQIEYAITLCQQTDNTISRMIEKGITRIGRPLNDINATIENLANLEVTKLEKGLPTMATIAGAAPMIGFLGTVIGMIQAFYDMANAGSNIDVQLLSSGIYTAMVTTVAGLTVGIIAFFAYNILVARVERVVYRLQARATEVMDLLNEPVNSQIMAIKNRSKVSPTFSMSSMTDIVFLLLIFFMVTSTLIAPNALKLLLPQSNSQTQANKPITTVSITKDLNYAVESTVMSYDKLESYLKNKVGPSVSYPEPPTISLHADKSVPIEYVVKVMNIAKRNKYKLILATAPESK